MRILLSLVRSRSKQSSLASCKHRCFISPSVPTVAVRFLGFSVSSLLRISRLIDWINERVGRKHVMWLVLIAVVISAGNALVRKLFNTSSNALLEIQWYLFAAIFMLLPAPSCAMNMCASIC